VSKMKMMFEKMCSIVVIVFFSYLLFFVNVRKEIISLCQRAWISFWMIIKLDSVTIIISSLIAVYVVLLLISLILEDNVKKGKKKIEKKKEKKEKKEQGKTEA